MSDTPVTDPAEPTPEDVSTAEPSTETVDEGPAGEWVAPPVPAADDAVDPTVGTVGPNAVNEETATVEEAAALPSGPFYTCNNCGALLLQDQDGAFVNSAVPHDQVCSGNDGGTHEVN